MKMKVPRLVHFDSAPHILWLDHDPRVEVGARKAFDLDLNSTGGIGGFGGSLFWVFSAHRKHGKKKKIENRTQI
jgi:hypothetical protein